MKQILYIIFCTMLVACSLEENPRDQIREEKAYATPEALYQNTVATLYNYIGGCEDGQGLQGTCRGIYDLQTFASDEAILPTRSADWYDGGIWQELYRHSWSAGHPLLNNSWLYLYKVITLCNRSIEQLEAHKSMLDVEELASYTAEVQALRAICYWYLLDLFGRVPILTSTQVSKNDVKQSERIEVFDFVEKELLEACVNLPEGRSAHTGDFYGRVTLSVACFVLAKLMLNAEVYTGTPRWEDCIAYCDRIENMGYRLEDDYSTNFAVHNEISMENIWTIPMNRELYRNQQQNIIRSLHYRHAAIYGYGGENGTCAPPHIMKIFGYGTDEKDERLDLNYWTGVVNDPDYGLAYDRTGEPLVYYPMAVDMDISGSLYVETAGARMKKYEIDKNAINGGKLVENDIVLFRYADVLLMRAEAKFRCGQDGQADFNAVRERVKMDTRPITLENLLDERLMELCWEGWRRQDLIRFNQYESLFQGDSFYPKVNESDGHTCLFPIPAAEIALNQNLKQNEGY